jgi:MFS transporter, ACS family, tartrate transporter
MNPMYHAVFAKCARRLIPFVVLLFTVNFLDRVNVGFAALTMNRDLGFSPAVFGFGAGVFFLGYFVFEVPSNLVLARIGARRWIAFIMVVWGAVSAACAFVQDAWSFYVLRFVLGAAEAGFFPGILYYLTLWFPREYRARFAATLIAAGPIAGVIGGPLAVVLLGMEGIYGLHGWQWLFLIEGLPACLLAFAVVKLMPDGPEQASWLTSAERALIAKHIEAEAAGKEVALLPAFKDPRVLALSIALMGMQSGLFGIALWLPQIVQSMGHSVTMTGLLVAPPYLLSAVAMILWARSSDRANERVRHLAAAALLATAGLLVAGFSGNNYVVLGALCIGMIGIHSSFGPFWGIPTSFLGDKAAAAGIAFINSIGSLGGFLAPTYIGILREQSGGYGSSMLLLAALLLASGCIVFAVGRVLPAAGAGIALPARLDGKNTQP